MDPIYLFGLASRHAQWASLRQATIAGNIAQADIPGYKARDVEAFSSVLAKTQLRMAQTDDGHVDVRGVDARQSRIEGRDSWDVTLSGNSVSLDQEMIKADEVNRAYSLDINIMRSFHRMLLTSVRS
ncbi:flagellar basal body rod protein FlgB [Aquabacter spiritensis]|uniref:Flagellar basal body rod protein FlgB n=1 Tax=Aquabacter spiritensis TaxID=933073 RepID=A0A4R3M3T7_9HYPH|nr:flagellar basal body rod protein FlgB [Aquabacter spiritensis]TCT07934.1 flagellar basal-body rod protein FlgB [Aquabacter spiritensis]